MRVSAVLRRTTDGYTFWCPGCKCAHHLPVGEGPGPKWAFDGNVERPTFSPSLRVFVHAMPAEDDYPATPEKTLYHLFVKAGTLEFLSDSAHALAGQTVSMTDMDTIMGYGWGDGDA